MALKWVSGHLSLREANRRERLLQDLTGSPGLIIDVDLLQRTICARVREITGCQSAVMCEYAPAREAFVAAASNDLDPAMAEQMVIRAGGRLARWLRVNEEPLPVPDSRGVVEYLEPDEQAVLTSFGVRVCLPLVAVNRLVGILLLADARPHWRLASDELEFLGRCGRQIALVCESAYLQRAERERIQTAARAQQLALAGQLAAAVAHEIRNPLHAIRSSVQYVMRSGSASGAQDELLQNVLDEVDRIGHTIAGLLTVSRPRDLELSDIDLVDVAERAMRLMDPFAENAGVKMTGSFECRPLPIRGDPNELGQVFVNVMLNACQAMASGGRIDLTSKLSLDDSPAEHASPFATIEVRDNGPGIGAAHLSRVFDPFFTTKVTGTGLGLPICLDIMTRHQGHIRVDSDSGHGTTVSIAAPLRQVTWPAS